MLSELHRPDVDVALEPSGLYTVTNSSTGASVVVGVAGPPAPTASPRSIGSSPAGSDREDPVRFSARTGAVDGPAHVGLARRHGMGRVARPGPRTGSPCVNGLRCATDGGAVAVPKR